MGERSDGVTSLRQLEGWGGSISLQKENEHLSLEKNKGLNLPWMAPGALEREGLAKGSSHWDLCPLLHFPRAACSQWWSMAGTRFPGNAPWEVGDCSDGSSVLKDLPKAWLNLPQVQGRLTYFHPTFPPSLGVRPALFAGSSSFFQLPSYFLSSVS